MTTKVLTSFMLYPHNSVVWGINRDNKQVLSGSVIKIKIEQIADTASIIYQVQSHNGIASWNGNDVFDDVDTALAELKTILTS